MNDYFHVFIQLHTALLQAEITPSLKHVGVQKVVPHPRNDLELLVVPAIELAPVHVLVLHRHETSESCMHCCSWAVEHLPDSFVRIV